MTKKDICFRCEACGCGTLIHKETQLECTTCNYTAPLPDLLEPTSVREKHLEDYFSRERIVSL